MRSFRDQDEIMKRFALAAAAAGVLLSFCAAEAQEDTRMSMPMMSHADNRQEVDLPPHLRQHMLSNMRGHLEALQDILAALSAGDSGKAAVIAETRLGLDSPGAAACNPNGQADMSAMAAMMAEHMPAEMRSLGLAMHQSASGFAKVAAKTKAGDDIKPVLAALSQVTQHCAACHSAYRLK